ncbi:thioredoxin/Dam-replacing family protein [Aeromonas phage AerS_266]|nr:thioredoxin/Dam-replacing family protein [Aeromonas phage AerS_266]
MSDKKIVSICPTGHEGWYGDLMEFLGKTPNPAIHRFIDPISKEHVETTSAFPEKSGIGNAVMTVLGTGDAKEDSYAKVLLDSNNFYNSVLDLGPMFLSKNLTSCRVQRPCSRKILVQGSFQSEIPKTKIDMFEILKDAYPSEFGLNLAKRREQVCKVHHVCPACHAVQVQLVSWTNPIIIRKCRICKHTHRQFIPA